MTQLAMESALVEALYERHEPPVDASAPVMTGIGRPGVAIAGNGLSRNFGERQVLRDLSLTIAPGEFVAIVGRSGCGKSTLLRLLAGLDVFDAGEILIDRQPVLGLVDEARLMFQDARLLPWRRVVANAAIGHGGSEGYYAALSALRAVGLDGREHDWPATLSGGQRQRVALARALVSRPKLLLLDEPFGALDALTRLEMQRLIETIWLRQGFTVVLVTHDVSEAVALADRVIVLDEGAITLEVPVPNDRPRSPSSAKLAALERTLLDRLLRRHHEDGRVSRFVRAQSRFSGDGADLEIVEGGYGT